MTTKSAAPALTPRMPGSASGLRVTPCMTVPDKPERDADEQPDDRAGHAQRTHDQVVAERRVVVEEGVEHGAEGDGLGAVGHARHARAGEGDERDRQAGEARRHPTGAWDGGRRRVAHGRRRRPDIDDCGHDPGW